jgi:hypothetical protein
MPYWFVPDWVFHSTRRYRRFAQTRSAFEVKLGPSAPSWEPAATALLKKVEERLKEHDLDGAWHNLQEAMRKEIPGLHDPELVNREQILWCEAADKVQPGWRKNAIDQLMKESEDDRKNKRNPEGRALRLQDAQELLDGYYQNQYHKNSLLLGHLRNLFFIALIALLALLALFASRCPDPQPWPEWGWKTLLVIFLFGVLGASFSATRTVTDASGKSRIPELAAGFSITIARTLLGAIPALAAYAALKSGVLNVGDENRKSMPFALAIAFAAGFSERLVLNVLKSIDDKTGGESDSKGSGARQRTVGGSPGGGGPAVPAP